MELSRETVLEKKGLLEKLFKLSENKTDVKTEVLAGITTFMTMAYILVVNPSILGDVGMDKGAVFVATALSAAVASIVMALYANYPFVLAPGMGLNAFFAYTVVKTMGYSWQFALTAVFLEGIIFIFLTFLNIREKIIDCIPESLKNAVTAGMGMFIAFIGMAKAGIVKQGGAILEIGNLRDPLVILTLVGLIVTGVLLSRNVKGALLIGMLITSVAGMVLGLVDLPKGVVSVPPSLAPIFGAFLQPDKAQIFSFQMLVIVFTFLFVNLFDTIGCLVGLSAKAGMLDENGKLPRAKQALFADAIGTTFGAILGTSTVTTYIESAAGVAEGGRTGLTAFVSGILLLVSIFFAPLFTAIPAQSTAPILILVGVMMATAMLRIDFHDMSEAIPAFLTIVMMPLSYSIAEGLVFGIVSYAGIKLFSGKGKTVTTALYVLAVIFIIKIALVG